MNISRRRIYPDHRAIQACLRCIVVPAQNNKCGFYALVSHLLITSIDHSCSISLTHNVQGSCVSHCKVETSRTSSMPLNLKWYTHMCVVQSCSSCIVADISCISSNTYLIASIQHISISISYEYNRLCLSQSSARLFHDLCFHYDKTQTGE